MDIFTKLESNHVNSISMWMFIAFYCLLSLNTIFWLLLNQINVIRLRKILPCAYSKYTPDRIYQHSLPDSSNVLLTQAPKQLRSLRRLRLLFVDTVSTTTWVDDMSDPVPPPPNESWRSWEEFPSETHWKTRRSNENIVVNKSSANEVDHYACVRIRKKSIMSRPPRVGRQHEQLMMTLLLLFFVLFHSSSSEVWCTIVHVSQIMWYSNTVQASE